VTHGYIVNTITKVDRKEALDMIKPVMDVEIYVKFQLEIIEWATNNNN